MTVNLSWKEKSCKKAVWEINEFVYESCNAKETSWVLVDLKIAFDFQDGSLLFSRLKCDNKTYLSWSK